MPNKLGNADSSAKHGQLPFTTEQIRQASKYMVTPSRLYKYEPFTAQSLQNLKDQVVYFGSPLRFNDPYDCALSPSIKEPTDAELEKIRRHYLAKSDLDAKIRRQLETASTVKLRTMLLSIGKDVLDKAIADFLSRRGVSCFSERVDSLLMWSHYGDHCKGFCLEFATSADAFQKMKQVQYKQEMPIFDIVPMLCDGDYDAVLDLYTTKAIDWAYEHEWRCLHHKAGTAYVYPTDALTGIYFGPDMSSTAFEIIALILAGQNEHVQLWQGSRSKSNFSVEFRPVTYTSYVDAKRQGLVGKTGT